jgi:ribose transport system permease protein
VPGERDVIGHQQIHATRLDARRRAEHDGGKDSAKAGRGVHGKSSARRAVGRGTSRADPGRTTTGNVIAGNLIGQDESKSVPVLLLMIAFGIVVGLVNGLVTTLLGVPSFIVTLGMMLALLGGVYYVTGGSASGNPADGFREIGRGGIRDVPVFDIIPWAVIILAVALAVAIWISKSPFGKTLIAVGDNVTTQQFSGVRVWWVKTSAFVISALSATIAGVLLVGYAGVHPSVGRGYEFIAITAVVLGGVVLGGGRGWVVAAVAGAFALEALFTLLNFADVPSTWRDTIQGVIIIAAVAYSAVAFRARRKARTPQASPVTEKESEPDGSPAKPATHNKSMEVE